MINKGHFQKKSKIVYDEDQHKLSFQEEQPTYLPAVPNFTIYKPKDVKKTSMAARIVDRTPPPEFYDPAPEHPTFKQNYFSPVHDKTYTKVSFFSLQN